jgi:hypothetical protein
LHRCFDRTLESKSQIASQLCSIFTKIQPSKMKTLCQISLVSYQDAAVQ